MPSTTISRHPNGSEIHFEEESHRYFIPGLALEFTSVTALIHRYFAEFDAPMVAEKMVRKQLRRENRQLSQEEVTTLIEAKLAEWENNKNQACDFGTRIHEFCEKLLLTLQSHKDSNQLIDYFKSHPVPRVSEIIPSTSAYDKEDVVKLLASREVYTLFQRYEFLEAERVIFSVDLGLAGTIDLLMRDPKTGVVYILDWKTNKKISSENRWQKGLEPIDHLDDCAISHYGLQLSVYQYLLIEEGYFPPETTFVRQIIHLHQEEGIQIYNLGYYEREVEAILDNFRSKREGVS
jgi:ATP-dependent exoDNAse (exonuclease V) beta subunit